jgi:hypothetical protein
MRYTYVYDADKLQQYQDYLVSIGYERAAQDNFWKDGHRIGFARAAGGAELNVFIY